LLKSVKNLGDKCKELASTAKNVPEEIGTAMKALTGAVANTVENGTALAATLDSKTSQKGLIKALQVIYLNNQSSSNWYLLKAATGEIRGLMQLSRAVAANPEDANLYKLLVDSGKAVAEALIRLSDAAKGGEYHILRHNSVKIRTILNHSNLSSSSSAKTT
jgi:hypothetical protein